MMFDLGRLIVSHQDLSVKSTGSLPFWLKWSIPGHFWPFPHLVFEDLLLGSTADRAECRHTGWQDFQN